MAEHAAKALRIYKNHARDVGESVLLALKKWNPMQAREFSRLSSRLCRSLQMAATNAEAVLTVALSLTRKDGPGQAISSLARLETLREKKGAQLAPFGSLQRLRTWLEVGLKQKTAVPGKRLVAIKTTSAHNNNHAEQPTLSRGNDAISWLQNGLSPLASPLYFDANARALLIDNCDHRSLRSKDCEARCDRSRRRAVAIGQRQKSDTRDYCDNISSQMSSGSGFGSVWEGGQTHLQYWETSRVSIMSAALGTAARPSLPLLLPRSAMQDLQIGCADAHEEAYKKRALDRVSLASTWLPLVLCQMQAGRDGVACTELVVTAQELLEVAETAASHARSGYYGCKMMASCFDLFTLCSECSLLAAQITIARADANEVTERKGMLDSLSSKAEKISARLIDAIKGLFAVMITTLEQRIALVEDEASEMRALQGLLSAGELQAIVFFSGEASLALACTAACLGRLLGGEKGVSGSATNLVFGTSGLVSSAEEDAEVVQQGKAKGKKKGKKAKAKGKSKGKGKGRVRGKTKGKAHIAKADESDQASEMVLAGENALSDAILQAVELAETESATLARACNRLRRGFSTSERARKQARGACKGAVTLLRLADDFAPVVDAILDEGDESGRDKRGQELQRRLEEVVGSAAKSQAASLDRIVSQ